MKLLDSARSLFSGQTQEAFGSGERFPLTKQMIQKIRRHMSGLEKTDLTAYTFERRHSDYPGAKSDIVIYNDSGQIVLNGREISGGPTSFWSPSQVDVSVPKFYVEGSAVPSPAR